MVASSVMALALARLSGIGAPLSEFAAKDSVWWTSGPLMWPALFGDLALCLEHG